MQLPAALLCQHDEDDRDVANDPSHHAEDVYTEVEAELWFGGPGVRHGLGRVIADWKD